MRKSVILFSIALVGIIAIGKAQTADNRHQKDTTKQMNLLDEQTKMFDQIFTLAGAGDEENPTGGATNYLDLIENMEGSEELKTHLREIYHLYDTSLDPTKKEELRIKFTEMLEEAMAKSQSNPE